MLSLFLPKAALFNRCAADALARTNFTGPKDYHSIPLRSGRALKRNTNLFSSLQLGNSGAPCHDCHHDHLFCHVFHSWRHLNAIRSCFVADLIETVQLSICQFVILSRICGQ